MVMAAKPGDGHHPHTGRYLNQERVSKALDLATDMGAAYAEVRLVALSETSIAMRDGALERAIPGQELGMTCLLYTSPSPRDRQKSRMPSSA